MNEHSKASVSAKLFYQLMGNDQSKLDKLMLELEDLTTQKALSPQPVNPSKLPALQPNVELPGASTAISLVDSKDNRKGKFVVANRPIDTGETVLAEKAITACLYPRYYGSHCIHCFQRSATLFSVFATTY
jgi:SET and MYND domain-containing protein 4